MQEPAAQEILAKLSRFLSAEVHLARFYDVGKRVIEQIRIHDLDVVRIWIYTLAGQTMDRSHKLAVGPGSIRSPAPALRRKEVSPAEFRAMVWRQFRHRVSVEVAMRNRVLPVHETREIKFGRFDRRIGQ